MLVGGFLKIFAPMLAGTLAAMAVGMVVGPAFGMSAHDVFFFVLVPALGGGVGEGAIPLSIGYGAILHIDQGPLLARILPAVMFASLTVIVFSGLLSHYARRQPHLTGNGTLQMDEHDEPGLLHGGLDVAAGPAEVAAAGATAVCLYLIGLLGQTLFKFPGPITMLVLAVALNLARAVPPALRSGAYVYYRFFATAVTYPLLFAIGVTLTPWDKLIAAFTPAMVVTIVAAVAALMSTGFVVGPLVAHVPDRGGDRHRLPRQPGRYRRCRHPDRRGSAQADALRPDFDADRRRGHGDRRVRAAQVPRLTARSVGLCQCLADVEPLAPDCCVGGDSRSWPGTSVGVGRPALCHR